MKLNRKLMSVAVAGALAAPALAYAQASTVQLFGRANFLYGYYDNGGGGTTTASGGALPGTPRVRNDALADTESEIGVRGEEQVGGGMAVHFQCLSSFDVTGIRAAAGTAGWCGRNSNIGLKGGFGNVFWGNYDVPIKIMMASYRVFALNYPMGLGNLISNSSSNVDNGVINGGAPGQSAAAIAAGIAPTAATLAQTSFSRRQVSSIHYWSPVMSGFQGMVAYSATNQATQATSASVIQKPRMFSAALNYKNGPFGIGIGWEKHRDYNPAVQAIGTGVGLYSGGSDTSWQAGVGYKFMGKLQLNFQYAHLNYELAGGQGMTINNWDVNGQWDIAGPHFIRVGYVRVGDTKGTAGTPTVISATGVGSAPIPLLVGQYWANGGRGDTGAQKFVFEYGYNLSKRTELTLGYAKTNNDRFSNLSVGGNSDANNFGESQTYVGGRISHRF